MEPRAQPSLPSPLGKVARERRKRSQHPHGNGFERPENSPVGCIRRFARCLRHCMREWAGRPRIRWRVSAERGPSLPIYMGRETAAVAGNLIAPYEISHYTSSHAARMIPSIATAVISLIRGMRLRIALEAESMFRLRTTTNVTTAEGRTNARLNTSKSRSIRP